MADDIRPAIAAVIRRKDGRFLVIRRAAGIPAAGFWSPPTGRVEAGEPLERAVEREVVEETGLVVRAGREIFRCPSSDGRWMIVWLEAAPADPAADPPLALQAAEVAEARWVSAAEALLLEPMFPATRVFFRSLNDEGRKRAAD